jgi:hypothetical protein
MVKKGCDVLGRYNLLDEPWIMVMTEDGENKKVSLKDVFRHAHEYQSLAGDMVTQDFAVMRVLLAVLHTVFSRVNAEGETYKYLILDNRYLPQNEIEEDDADDYAEDLFETWETLWQKGRFPEIVETYLEDWRDRFYLFDETYPFYQVTKESIAPDKINTAEAGTIFGKNINRLISESKNKVALFSPKYEGENNKEILNADEIARWLITFQGYTGVMDKTVFRTEKYTTSKGWLFDLGGIYLSGDNLFQTLWLNCMLYHTEESYRIERQCPCWEYTGEELIKTYLQGKKINNLAELYTNWSRAIYIPADTDAHKPFSLQAVKLPEIEHKEQFLEPMTLWQFNQSGPNKDCFTPRKHKENEALWRSFGLLTLSYRNDMGRGKIEAKRKPEIMAWLDRIKSDLGDKDIRFSAVSMKDDGNPNSRVPTDEIYDELQLSYDVIADEYWIPRINDAVEETKEVIESIYGRFLRDVKDIRRLGDTSGFVGKEKEKLYFMVDAPFRRWLSQLKVDDRKEEAIKEWRKRLKVIVEAAAEKFWQTAGHRDYIGIDLGKDSKTSGAKGIKNIATAYRWFRIRLYKKLQ